MPSGDLERTARERADADRRYNDALTALDRCVVELARRPELTRDDILQLCSVLVVFLQQITAYIDSKDRESTASIDVRLTAHEDAMRSIQELGQQVALLQRTVKAARRPTEALAANVPLPASPEITTSAPSTGVGDAIYLGFEDRFRGPEADVAARMRAYIPIFASHSDVVDLGCGRGEFLALLRDAGVSARGVDANQEMVAVTTERGLHAVAGDALTYLRGVPDESIGGLIAAQVVEHLTPPYLIALLETAYQKLRPESPIVLETINPACWLAFFSSYLRDFTHVKPVHPDTLHYLLQASGFSRVSVRYSAPVPEEVRMKAVDLPAPVLGSGDPTARAIVQTAHALNANTAILNNLLFSHLDYAAIAYRS